MSKKKSKSTEKAKGFWTSSPSKPSTKAAPTIRDVQALAARGRTQDAKKLLTHLLSQSPHRVDLWQELLELSAEVQDYSDVERACERLAELEPGNPEHLLNLLGAYIHNIRPMLARETCNTLLTNYPDLSRAEDIKKTLGELDGKTEELLQEIGLSGEDGVAIAVLHERLQVKMQQGDFQAFHQIVSELLARKPDFVPALNNLSMVQFLEANFAGAIATVEQVLAIDPHNIHALANLIRYLHITGRTAETAEYVDRLKAVDSSRSIAFLKQAEAFSYLGNDQDVLAVVEAATAAGFEDGLLHHFAGAAAMRLGQVNRAKQHWQRSVALAPYLGIAQENLDDLSRPVGERNAPYAFEMYEWLPASVLAGLLERLPDRVDTSDDEMMALTRNYFQEHPEILRMVPILLERGDAASRDMVIQLAKIVELPELWTIVRDFAFSQWGSDNIRHSAAIAAQKAGLIKPGQVRMWIQGDWRDIYLMSFEITDEPKEQLEPRAQKLLERSLTLLRQEKGVEAEKLLKQALETEPDAPSLHNNLAVAYTMQGREEEAEALIRELHDRYPDYVMACTSLAKMYAQTGDYAQADALIKPLFERTIFHVIEYSAFCDAQITILHAKGEFEGAKAWVKMWRDVTPDHPTLEYWQYRLMMRR